MIGLLTYMDECVVKDRLSNTPIASVLFFPRLFRTPFFAIFLAMRFLLLQTARRNRIRPRGSKRSESELQGGHFFHLPTSYGCAPDGVFSRALREERTFFMDGAFSHALAYFNQTVTLLSFREILGCNFLFSLLIIQHEATFVAYWWLFRYGSL